MIYEEENWLNHGTYSPIEDSRYITASSYLKGLHWHDAPTELMPRDAIYLKSARRFYEGLSEDDQLVIDSYSDEGLYETMNKRQRDKRFSYLCQLFMYQMDGTAQHMTFMLQEIAEKGKENESNQQKYFQTNERQN